MEFKNNFKKELEKLKESLIESFKEGVEEANKKRCKHTNFEQLNTRYDVQNKWILVRCKDCGLYNAQHIFDYKNKAFIFNKRVWPGKFSTIEKGSKLIKKLYGIYENEQRLIDKLK